MKKVEFGVGLLVLAAIGAIFLLAFKVSALDSLIGKKSYAIYAKFENIGGLKVRAPVKIGGVRIGEVSNISLDTDDLLPVVTLAINSKYSQLPTETAASILTTGLLGEQFISMSIGGDDIYLQAGDTIEDTQSAIVLEDLISQLIFSEDSDES